MMVLLKTIRKLFPLLLYFILCVICMISLNVSLTRSWNTMIIGGQTITAEGAGCMSGTYNSAWDGDYTGDDEEFCFDSGGSTKSGTLNGAVISTDYGESGNGLISDSDNDYLSVAISSDDGASDTIGTVFVRVKIIDDGTDADTIVWEMQGDGNNYHYIMIKSDREVRLYGRIDGSLGCIIDSASAISEDTWVTVGASWRSNAGSDCAVSINGGSSWTEQDRDVDPTYVDVDVTQYLIGNELIGFGDVIHVDKIAVINSWEASSPW